MGKNANQKSGHEQHAHEQSHKRMRISPKLGRPSEGWCRALSGVVVVFTNATVIGDGALEAGITRLRVGLGEEKNGGDGRVEISVEGGNTAVEMIVVEVANLNKRKLVKTIKTEQDGEAAVVEAKFDGHGAGQLVVGQGKLGEQDVGGEAHGNGARE